MRECGFRARVSGRDTAFGYGFTGALDSAQYKHTRTRPPGHAMAADIDELRNPRIDYLRFSVVRGAASRFFRIEAALLLGDSSPNAGTCGAARNRVGDLFHTPDEATAAAVIVLSK